MQDRQRKSEIEKRCRERKQIKSVGFDATPDERELIDKVQNITGLGRKAAILTACRAFVEANEGKSYKRNT